MKMKLHISHDRPSPLTSISLNHCGPVWRKESIHHLYRIFFERNGLKTLSTLFTICIIQFLYAVCGRLVVRSRLRGRRAPGSKPDFTEYPSCMGPTARQIKRRQSSVLQQVPAQVLTAVQNHNVLPKIALELLRNETLV
ncbi:hypothetical protein AVEN_110771-1 [Araneus ventricosus]|uniref:Uncharacterized protein n=1 Tax=Araneus ventricosus TaxID=182803 RepID=A0A4Y2PH58_ARAVE|nr:hypothetical protein AVEN_3406-1 [Araneus ventricosus]GBN49820.1 hypothetical protein AVEN_83351-1 [Araneus ventricosus]GBN49826.1 hypothetical protein AVEN_88743-1 [Araneus ventricosus]GBN49829.1 hypothetical protein AVEN_110771-1 [Araneus ventricosus]